MEPCDRNAWLETDQLDCALMPFEYAERVQEDATQVLEALAQARRLGEALRSAWLLGDGEAAARAARAIWMHVGALEAALSRVDHMVHTLVECAGEIPVFRALPRPPRPPADEDATTLDHGDPAAPAPRGNERPEDESDSDEGGRGNVDLAAWQARRSPP